jgi:surface antigen
VEALEASSSALAIAPPGHLTSRAIGQRVHAKALARAGRLAEAQALAAETIELLAGTDVLDEQGEVFAAAAEIHALTGAAADADEAWGRALDAFERKGNVVSAARVRAAR